LKHLCQFSNGKKYHPKLLWRRFEKVKVESNQIWNILALNWKIIWKILSNCGGKQKIPPLETQACQETGVSERIPN